jgi:hypothetical protein
MPSIRECWANRSITSLEPDCYCTTYGVGRDPIPPSLHESCASNRPVSLTDLCARLQASFSCPILRAVFEPSWAPATISVPITIFESAWEQRIADAIWLLLGDHPVPLTFFGDYHQLCVHNPLGTDCSHRYERGVHYTPAPIVDYLVNSVLGRVLAGRSIDDAKRLRILDPSCGCGAFLIAAWRYLLRWFEEHTSGVEASGRAVVQARLDALSRMLLGVDMDERAVDWTVRLLSLTAWEASISESHRVPQAPVLVAPDFQKGIFCQSFLDVVPDLQFGQVDVIIGGPPFVRLRELHRSQHTQIRAFRKRFRTARRGQFDLYMLFIEKALELLADGGYLGFSVANTFIRTIGGDRIRRLISQRSRVIEIVEFEDKEVYPEAVTQIALLTLAKGIPLDRSRHLLVKGVGDLRRKLNRAWHADRQSVCDIVVHEMPAYSFDWPDWHLLPDEDATWLAQIRFGGRRLERLVAGIRQGLNTGADDVFLMREVGRTFKRIVFARSRVDGKTYRLEADIMRPIVRGRHIKGYQSAESPNLCVFPFDASGRMLTEDELREQFPFVYQYLTQCRSRLSQRPAKHGVPWYASWARDVEALPVGLRLISSKISAHRGFTLIDGSTTVCHNSVVMIVPDASKIDPFSLLGILNSQVFWRFLRLTTPYMGAGRQVLRLADVRRFPIPWPMTEEQCQLCRHIGSLAQKATAGCDINALPDQIDVLVNQLFGSAAFL